MQPHQTPPFALVGPRVGPRPRQMGEPLLLLQLRAPRCAGRRLQIVSQRLGSRSASRWQAEDLELRNDALQRQAQMIADAHAMRRFDAFRVQMNFAAADGGRRQTARLVEPGMPQPLIEAMIVGFSRLS